MREIWHRSFKRMVSIAKSMIRDYMSFWSEPKKKGIKFNKDKLGVTQVRYFGHLLTDNRLKPDPDKVKAIQSMKLPTAKSEHETFLWTIFIWTNPLHKLAIQHTNELQWDLQQIDAFENIKSIVIDSPVLTYYDQHKSIKSQIYQVGWCFNARREAHCICI